MLVGGERTVPLGVEVYEILTEKPFVVLPVLLIVSGEVLAHDQIHEEPDELIQTYDAYWSILGLLDPNFILGAVRSDEADVRWVLHDLLEEPRCHEPHWEIWPGCDWLRPLH